MSTTAHLVRERFFTVLPTDIQHVILQTWIARPADERSLLKHMSAMDMACCNYACREQALILLGRVAFISPYPAITTEITSSLGKMLPFLAANLHEYAQWLFDRHIQIKSVTISPQSDVIPCKLPCLAQVINLTLFGDCKGFDPTQLVQMLEMCPNVTSIHSYHALPVADWAIIVINTPLLRKLQIFDFVVTRDVDTVFAFLKTLPFTIEELRLPAVQGLYDSVLEAWAERLKNLKVLEFFPPLVTVNAIIQLVTACKQLEYFDLKTALGLALCEQGVLEGILDAGTNLKTFLSYFYRRPNHLRHHDEFVPVCTIVEQYTRLDAFEVNNCAFSRSQKSFGFQITERLSVDVLHRILNSCLGIKTLNIGIKHSHKDMAAMLALVGAKLGSTLVDVSIIEQGVDGMIDKEALLAMLQRTPHITSLKIDYAYAIADEMLSKFVAACPKLENFHFSCDLADYFDEEIEETSSSDPLEIVLSSCGHHLKTMHFYTASLQSSHLQIILDRKLRLEVLHCQGINVSTEELSNFCAKMADLQLLPVLQIGKFVEFD